MKRHLPSLFGDSTTICWQLHCINSIFKLKKNFLRKIKRGKKLRLAESHVWDTSKSLFQMYWKAVTKESSFSQLYKQTKLVKTNFLDINFKYSYSTLRISMTSIPRWSWSQELNVKLFFTHRENCFWKCFVYMRYLKLLLLTSGFDSRMMQLMKFQHTDKIRKHRNF